MNSFLLIFSCVIAGVFTQGVGFNFCEKVPAASAKVEFPTATKLYQVYRENKIDDAKCYTLSTSAKGAINQTLISQGYPISSIYYTKVTKDSTWNVTSENGKLCRFSLLQS